MKKQTIFAVLCLACLLPHAASAQTNLLESFQRGLFEEEANQNFDAAIQWYQSVLSGFEQQQQLAATALFRLAETYRKKGEKDLATAQYQRLLNEFPNQELLVRLSRENLVILGLPAAGDQAAETAGLAATRASEEAEEIKRLQRIVAQSPDLINAPGEANLPPLHRAAALGHLAVARFLIDHGAEIHRKARDGDLTPLHLAAHGGHRAVAEFLINNGADPNGRARSGATPLHFAAWRGFRAMGQLLLDHGANPNIEATEQLGHFSLRIGSDSIHVEVPSGTPLHLAAMGGFPAFCALLLEHGADFDFSSKGSTPLHSAVNHRKPETARLLLERGADPNLRHPQAGSPLQSAVNINQPELLDMLLEFDPNLELPDGEGFTPLHRAIQADRMLTERLLRAGANPDAPYPHSHRAPLHRAAALGEIGLVELLLEFDARTDLQDEEGNTPLHLAAQHGFPQIASLLLKHGANPHAKNVQQQTGLHLAVQNLFPETARVLLQSGADVNARIEEGYTPLDIVQLTFVPQQRSPAQIAAVNLRSPVPVAPMSLSRTPPRFATIPPEQKASQDTIKALLLEHGAKRGMAQVAPVIRIRGTPYAGPKVHWDFSKPLTLGELTSALNLESLESIEIRRTDPETEKSVVVREFRGEEFVQHALESKEEAVQDGDHVTMGLKSPPSRELPHASTIIRIPASDSSARDSLNRQPLRIQQPGQTPPSFQGELTPEEQIIMQEIQRLQNPR